MKVVATIQARMGSTRLPGKVLLDWAGEPMLARVIERIRRAETVDEVVVATTVRPSDHPIADLCVERNWACCRGSENDVLDRYYQTAVAHQADVVVRITSDCPLIEPAIVDRVVREFLEGQPTVHCACNLLPVRTFPRGLGGCPRTENLLRKR
jgi:spore coat polysaccharide biosynthesis protein SpsF (cytidylyltransferase family)